MNIEKILSNEITADDVLYAMVNQGADPFYVEYIEDAEQIADEINSARICKEIEKGTEDWDIAVRQLDLEYNDPQRIFYFGNWNEECSKVCFFEDYTL